MARLEAVYLAGEQLMKYHTAQTHTTFLLQSTLVELLHTIADVVP